MKNVNRKGLEIIPSTFVLLLIVIAAAVAVTLILMGKWLEIVGFRYKLETQRNAMNFIQFIVANSPIVEKEFDEPNKLIIDFNELDKYSKRFEVTDPNNPSDEHKKWEECCDFLDFDHNLTVIDLSTGIPVEFGNLIFQEESECYAKRVQGFADVPVVIYRNGEYRPGIAYVEVRRTTLSDVSFWLSQAYMRASWPQPGYWEVFTEETSYSVFIPLDPEVQGFSIHNVDGNHKRICANLTNDRFACKTFIFDENEVRLKKYEIDPSSTCYSMTIDVMKLDGKNCVQITYPGTMGLKETC